MKLTKIVIFLLLLGAGIAIGFFLGNQKEPESTVHVDPESSDPEKEELEAELEELRKELESVQATLAGTRDELKLLREVESEYAAKRAGLEETLARAKTDRQKAEEFRKVAQEAARRLQDGDETALGDPRIAEVIAEPHWIMLGDETSMKVRGPQGVVSFQGEDVIMIPSKNRVLIDKSREIAAGLRSRDSSDVATLDFRNRSEEERLVFWIDEQGSPQLAQSLDPGEAFRSDTFRGHQWVVTDLDGNRIQILEPIQQEL